MTGPPPYAARTAAVLLAVLGGLVSGRDFDPAASPRAHADDGLRPAANPAALRISLTDDGPVGVSGADLAAAGWNLAAIDPAAIGLSAGGRPVALRYVPAATARGDPVHGATPNSGGDDFDAVPDRRAWPEPRTGRGDIAGGRGPTHGMQPGDRIEFIATRHRDDYTDTAVYWLEPDVPAEHRLRFGRRGGAPGSSGAHATAVYTHSLALEVDSVYVTAYRPDGGERWMWDGPLAAGSERRLDAVVGGGSGAADGRGPPVDGDAAIRVFVQGHTDDPAVSPDHHLRLSLGSDELAEARFDGRRRAVLSGRLPAAVLLGGPETPVLSSAGLGARVDAVFLDRIEVDYPAALHARSERIAFTVPGTAAPPDIRVSGFATPAVTVVDATDSDRPIELDGVAVDGAPDGGFAIRFAGARAGARYVAWAQAGARAPDRIETGRIRPLDAIATAAPDLVIVTHRDLVGAVGRLAAHRRAGGLATAVVATDDIYDLFAHGRFDPSAISRFLAIAKPRYTLLVGEANLDHRGGYAAARPGTVAPPNRVPSLQVELADGSVATSDLPFADFDGDGLPDTHLGRLPGATPEQVSAVVAKLIAFERDRPPAPSAPPAPPAPHRLSAPPAPPAGTGPPGRPVPPAARQSLESVGRRLGILAVSDSAAPAVDSVADGLAEALTPLAPEVERLYAGRIEASTDVRGLVGAAIEAGPMAVVYVGHGNVDTWAPWHGGGRMLRTADVLALENAGRLPLLLTATCMNGWFDHPLHKESIAEAWLINPGGGGVAAWSPTGLARLPGQAVLLHAFARALVARPAAPLGDLVGEAMAAAVGADPTLRDTVAAYALIGDPSLALFSEPPGSPSPGAPSPAPTGTPAPTRSPDPDPRPSPTDPPPPGDGRRLWLPAAHRGPRRRRRVSSAAPNRADEG